MSRARLLLGQFRRGEANDPATFVASVAVVLARYSEDIIIEVTDLKTGLATKGDWLPTIHEICSECDRLASEQAERRIVEDGIISQLEERRRLDALEAKDGKQRVSEALAKFKSRGEPNLAEAKAAERERAMMQLIELGADAGVTRQQIEALR